MEIYALFLLLSDFYTIINVVASTVAIYFTLQPSHFLHLGMQFIARINQINDLRIRLNYLLHN